MSTVDPALMDVREEIFELSPGKGRCSGRQEEQRESLQCQSAIPPVRSSSELVLAHTATSKPQTDLHSFLIWL